MKKETNNKEGQEQRDYELVVLFRPTVLKKQATDLIEKEVEKLQGKVSKVDDWGKRRLAYEIKKEKEALYLCFQLRFPYANLAELRQDLQRQDSILRFLLLKRG